MELNYVMAATFSRSNSSLTGATPTGATLTGIDRLGLALSFACALHCLAMPLILMVVPLLGINFFSHSYFDKAFLILTLLVASTSLCWGTRIHRQWRVWAFVIAAIACFAMSGAHLFGPHEGAGGPLDVDHYDLGTSFLFALGGFCLVAAHWVNLKLCKSCHSCESK